MWRALLRLYPREFRDEYGSDLLAALQDGYASESGSGRLRFAADATADLLSTAIQEHRHLMQRDIVHSFRRIVSQPAVTAVAILSLALGIGASTTMFSILYAAILRPLNYPDSDRRVALFSTGARNRSFRDAVTSSDFLDWRATSKMLDQWHLFGPSTPITVLAGGLPERVRSCATTVGLMDSLGARPVIGRMFQEGDREEETSLISEGYWQRRFGGSAEAIGQKLSIDGRVRTVVGVVPASFELFEEPSSIDVWVPIDLEPGSNWVGRKIPWLYAIARLKPGISIQQAQGEMSTLADGLEHTYPETNRERGALVMPMLSARNGNLPNFLLPLFGAVGFVLLIACSNVANLLLARAVTRRREVSVRAAMGASRHRLIREFLIDGLVLSVPGILCGVLVAYGGIALFHAVAPEGFPGKLSASLSFPVLLFTALAGLASALGASLVPAIQGTKVDLTDALKDGGRSSGTRSRRYLRSILVTAEVALALILLVGAGLMVNSLLRLQNQWLGFSPEQVTVARTQLSGDRYMFDLPKQDIDMRRVEPAVAQFMEHVVTRLEASPVVERAAFAATVPLGPGASPNVRVHVVGAAQEAPRSSGYNVITPGYFAVLRIPLLQGRLLTEQDTQSAPWVAVVNEAFARTYFADGRALGQMVMLGIGPKDRPRQIVGIVRDYRRGSLRQPVGPEILTSHLQNPSEIPGNFQGSRLRNSLILRSIGTPPSAEAISKVVSGFDKEVPVFDVNPLPELVASREVGLRFYGGFLSLFSAIAILLAAIGMFGLINHTVTDRFHEIGIRSSLGAGRANIVWLVVSYGLKLATLGLVVGLAGTQMLTKFLQSMLFEIKPYDPGTLFVTVAILLLLAVITCAIPALRATRIDPAVALRAE